MYPRNRHHLKHSFERRICCQGRAPCSTVGIVSKAVSLNMAAGRNAYCVASIAVGGIFGRMQPAPVGINYNGAALLTAAASSSTLLPGQRRVGFRCLSADLLSIGGYSKSRKKERALMHSDAEVNE